MANILEILIQATDKASKELDTISQSCKKMSGELKIAGAAMTAVGIAGLKMVGDARKMNAELGQIALTAGTSTEEMRKLALEVTNVTFSLDAVIGTFDILVRAGITSTEQIKKSAIAFDALADATGSTADQIADLLVPAFKLFGQAIPTTAADLDVFTWLVKMSTVDLEDFGTMVTRMAPYMTALNLSLQDAIVLLRALSEMGIQGTAATLTLRTAITQAAREGGNLNEILGISQEQLDKYRAEMEAATGITQEYADVANQQYGIIDRLKQKWSELTLSLGTFFVKSEALFTFLGTLGPMLIFLGTAHGKAALKTLAHAAANLKLRLSLIATRKVTIAATLAQWKLNAAMLANPIGLIIAAVAGLIVGLVALIRNWESVVRFMRGPAAQATHELAKATKNMAEAMIHDVGRAYDTLRSAARSTADTEIAELRRQQSFWKDMHFERMRLLDDRIMAELMAAAPEIAGVVGQINEEIKALDQERHARQVNAEEDRAEAIKADLLREGLSDEDRRRLQRELGDIKAQWKERELIERRNHLITMARIPERIDAEIKGIQETTQAAIDEFNAQEQAFKDAYDGTLGYLRDEWLPQYKDIMRQAGMEITVKPEDFAPEMPEPTPFWKRLLMALHPVSGLIGAVQDQQGAASMQAYEQWRKVHGFQHGGIVTKPTMGIVGEAGPEAVIPLDQLETGRGGGDIHIHVGYLVGDELSLSKFARLVKERIQRDDRRTAFGPVNQGYYYGRSST